MALLQLQHNQSPAMQQWLGMDGSTLILTWVMGLDQSQDMELQCTGVVTTGLLPIEVSTLQPPDVTKCKYSSQFTLTNCNYRILFFFIFQSPLKIVELFFHFFVYDLR